jgi:hypothetical protein
MDKSMVRNVFLGLAGLALAAPATAQSVKAGIAAWQKADYASAVAIWRPLAEGGDADAQFNLAQAYRLGRGVPTNLSAAKTWFERAAKQDHVDAETTLGLLLFQNGDQGQGRKWLKAAAEQGEPRALLVYGTALFNGDGVKQDAVLGYAFVSRAAAQGLAPAKQTLEQLDSMMPIDQRRKGLELAQKRAKANPAPSSRPVKAVKPAVAKPKPSAPVQKPAKMAIGDWRIQLGAFSQRGAAQSLFGKLSSALPGRQAYYIGAGAVTRLQVGPYESKAAANAACATLKGRGQACFVVPAK